MNNIYNWPLWHWHFELTSACTLKCPRCSRTELPDELVLDSLNLEFFKQNFSAELIGNIDRISFCGYDGDPIYNKQFIEICQYFKQIKPQIELYIVTNGSYKKTTWWANLASVLNKYDQIHFSIDGTDEETNVQYRVNSDWKSIMSGVRELAGKSPRLVWDFIYFQHNYHQVDRLREMARDLKFDAIRFTKSNKFDTFYNNYNKSLTPPSEFISSSGRFESNTEYISNRQIYNDSFKNAIMKKHITQEINGILPLCMLGSKGLYVDSQGYFYPCCWIVNKYNTPVYKKWLEPSRNIKQSGLESVLNANCWKEFIRNIPTNEICKLKCSASEVTNETIVRW